MTISFYLRLLPKAVACTYDVVALILRCVDFVIPDLVGAYVVKTVRNLSQGLVFQKSRRRVWFYIPGFEESLEEVRLVLWLECTTITCTVIYIPFLELQRAGTTWLISASNISEHQHVTVVTILNVILIFLNS
jgi:hypothetical protein